MKKIKEYLLTSNFLNTILFGGIVFVSQQWFVNKLAPETAAATLIKQNQINTKREIYHEAIEISNKMIAYRKYDIKGIVYDFKNRNIGTELPTEKEVNNCFAKLCLYSDDIMIANKFKDLCNLKDSSFPIALISDMIIAMRKDLGYGNSFIDTTLDNYHYIMLPKSDVE